MTANGRRAGRRRASNVPLLRRARSGARPASPTTRSHVGHDHLAAAGVDVGRGARRAVQRRTGVAAAGVRRDRRRRSAAPVPLNADAARRDDVRDTRIGGARSAASSSAASPTIGTATIESEPSEPICVTPADTFPPAAPNGPDGGRERGRRST